MTSQSLYFQVSTMDTDLLDSSLDKSTASAPFSTALAGSPAALTAATTLKKGLLWQQRDKIFSRWKERFFVLTADYLQCYKRGGGGGISEMGEFLFKVRMAEIEDVELLDKRGYLTICVSLTNREGKVYLRKTEGIREWFRLIRVRQEYFEFRVLPIFYLHV